VLLFANDDNNTWCASLTNMSDGTSNTVMIGEASVSTNVTPSIIDRSQFPTWAGSNNGISCNGTTSVGVVLRVMDGAYPLNGGADQAFGSRHTGGANFALGDGSVRFISNSVATNIYAAIGSRNGGEALNLE